jgi:hypothetical protein
VTLVRPVEPFTPGMRVYALDLLGEPVTGKVTGSPCACPDPGHLFVRDDVRGNDVLVREFETYLITTPTTRR